MSKISCDATESSIYKYKTAGKTAGFCGDHTNTDNEGALRRKETNYITPLKCQNEKGNSCNSLCCTYGAHLYAQWL
jgi:hypothetical protein